MFDNCTPEALMDLGLKQITSHPNISQILEVDASGIEDRAYQVVMNGIEATVVKSAYKGHLISINVQPELSDVSSLVCDADSTLIAGFQIEAEHFPASMDDVMKYIDTVTKAAKSIIDRKMN